MLAGLLFAFADTTDRPTRLVATLPFAEGTLIEHQARQLIEAGATQILVIADQAVPALSGALTRIARDGIAVDLVGSAAEAAARLHPLAHVVMLADGLIAANGVVAMLARGESEVLLVVPLADAPAGFERIGGAVAWAGAARLDRRRLDEVAALPTDYDPQSTLLRVAEAAGIERRPLPVGAAQQGHGVEHDGAALAVRAQRLAAASVRVRRGWFDRYLAAPLARVLLPVLVAQAVPIGAIAAVVGGLALISGLAIGAGWSRAGLALALLATVMAMLGYAFADLRGKREAQRGFDIASLIVPAVATLLLGWTVGAATADDAAPVLAVTLVVAAVIGERAIGAARGWWGGAAAYLAVVLLFALSGYPTLGLAAAAVYAAATLAAAVEALRQEA